MARTKKTTKAAPVASAKDYSIILGPVVTEKTSFIGNGGNTVAFRVAKKASKEAIKEAVERIFQKEVVSIRTANFIGKPKRRNRDMGRTPSYKKAFITLKEGQTIELVENA